MCIVPQSIFAFFFLWPDALRIQLVVRTRLIGSEYTHIPVRSSRTNVCVCACFNIDVIKSQLDLIQQASPDQNRVVFFLSHSFTSFFSPVRRWIFSFLYTHSLVSRWSSSSYIHSKKQTIVSFFFLLLSLFFLLRLAFFLFLVFAPLATIEKRFMCIYLHTSH